MSSEGDARMFEALRSLAAQLANYLGAPPDAVDDLVENALNTAEEKMGPEEITPIDCGVETQIYVQEDDKLKERVMRYYSAFK